MRYPWLAGTSRRARHRLPRKTAPRGRSDRAGRACGPGRGAAERKETCIRPGAPPGESPRGESSCSEVMVKRKEHRVPRLPFLALARQIEAQRPVGRQRVALPQARGPRGIGVPGEEALRAGVNLGPPARAEIGQRAEARAGAEREALLQVLVDLGGGFEKRVDHRVSLQGIGYGPGETGAAVHLEYQRLVAAGQTAARPARVDFPRQ